MAHKTVRRDMLRRLVDSGRLFMAESYSFDDMHGESRSENRAIPVRMMPADRNTSEGTCYLFESDFKSGSGSAWRNADGTITLYIHSTRNLTFLVLPEAS
jgi:hypothetical protein